MSNLIDHLKAVEQALAGLQYTTSRIWADSPPAQYLVLSGRAWDSAGEAALTEVTDTVDTDLRIKAVTGTPDGVGIMLARVRGVLSPNQAASKIAMAGRSVWVQFVRSEFIDVDTDTTITGTNRHPAYGVDTYRLLSEPA